MGKLTKVQYQLMDERNKDIMKKYNSGYSLAFIGKEKGLSRQRVKQIILEIELKKR